MKTPQMCSGRRYGSTDMELDIFRLGHDLDLWSTFQHDRLTSSYCSLDAYRREEHDTVEMDTVAE